MKKLLLLIIIAIIATFNSNAQIGGGFDSAFVLGGAGIYAKDVIVDSQGDTYFYALVNGKAFFAGQQIDGGAVLNFGHGVPGPAAKGVYGKVSPTGTQTLLKVIETGYYDAATLTASGDLLFALTGSTTVPIDLGNGVTNNTYGYYLARINHNGVSQWIKPMNTGSNAEYGKIGVQPAVTAGIQATPDGSIYAVVDAGANYSSTPPLPTFTVPHRVIKFDANGDEVWHNELFSNTTYCKLKVPKQFVSNSGEVTFNIHDNVSYDRWYYNGEEITTELSNYGNVYYSLILSLNADGTKKFNIADTQRGVGLKGVNPANGDLYIDYSEYQNLPSGKAPFNTLPSTFKGTLLFNSAGVYQKNFSDKDYHHDKLFFTPTNIIAYEKVGAYEVVDKEDYVFSDTEPFAVISYYDQNFSFLKALKTEEAEVYFGLGDKLVLGGYFRGTVTFGSTTLTASFNDTDFQTLYPLHAGIKGDIFIAKADYSNFTPPTSVKWLGIDNNWNNNANWSNNLVPDAGTIVEFDATTAQMPITASSPKALKVIIAQGVTASVPSALEIKNKLVINGTLQVRNSTAYYSFQNFKATELQGTGTLEFIGTGTASVYPSLPGGKPFGYKDLTLATNENVMGNAAVFKDVVFTGTNAEININLFELTSPDVNAIVGHSATNYFSGTLQRAVNSSGAYVFPNPSASATVTLNNLQGVQKISVGYIVNGANPDLNFAGGICKNYLGDYYWNVITDATSTSGTYDVTLKKSKFENGVTDPARYVVISRTDSNTPWTFEGTKTTSTQTGGTTSGSVVKNGDMSAGLTGLTKAGSFAVAINSTSVPDGTTSGTTTWTGATNTAWNNAGNWDNGIPNTTFDAIIPSGLTKYPAIYTTADYARSLTIAAGITGLKLSHILSLSKGLVNNSNVTISMLVGSQDLFSVYGGGISGSGKIMFKSPGLMHAVSGGDFNQNAINNDIDVDVSNGNYVNIIAKVGGNINVVSGNLSVNRSGGKYLELTNPLSTISITAPANQLYGDGIYKAVNITGTYNLYIGSVYKKYGEINITNNNITTASVYKVEFNTNYSEPVSLLAGSDAITSAINSGKWTISPSVTSTSGTVDLTFKTRDYTNGRVSSSDYVLLRRKASNGVKWVVVDGATISESAGTITVVANGLESFASNVEFCIGLKATTTTWTGTASQNWYEGSNWTNGVPDANIKAVIANASRYPSNVPAGSAAAIIEIASGATVSLPANFLAANGIINNGTINVKGTGVFYGFGYGNSASTFSTLSGTGKLVFNSASPTSFNGYYVGGIINNSVEIDNAAGFAIATTSKFNGDLILKNGIVTVATYNTLVVTNPNAIVTGNATSYIIGDLKRTINPTGTYNFPIGITGMYAPVSLALNGLVGPADIIANFSNIAIDGQPSLSINNRVVSSLLAGNSWTIFPNIQPTAGTYDVTLALPVGSSTASDYFILKRDANYSYYPWANQGTNVAPSITAGVVTASATGLTSFSQFAIGEGIGVLPVKMVKFLASADAKSAKLYWETASELNNDKFEVERRTNGKDFVKIGEVKGNGTSQKLNTYSFKDFAPPNGVNYYRLKQVDFNGDVEYSDSRFVSFDFAETTFSVYPNPVTDVINFSGMVKSVEIYSLQGVLLLKNSGLVSSVKVPDKFITGSYLIKLSLENGTSLTKQILIKK